MRLGPSSESHAWRFHSLGLFPSSECGVESAALYIKPTCMLRFQMYPRILFSVAPLVESHLIFPRPGRISNLFRVPSSLIEDMRRIVVTALTLVFCTCVHSLTIGQQSPITTEGDKQRSTIGKRHHRTLQIPEQSSTTNQNQENTQFPKGQDSQGSYPDRQNQEEQDSLPQFYDIQRVDNVHLNIPFPFQDNDKRPPTDQFAPTPPPSYDRPYVAFKPDSFPSSLQSGVSVTFIDSPDSLDTDRLSP